MVLKKVEFRIFQFYPTNVEIFTHSWVKLWVWGYKTLVILGMTVPYYQRFYSE